VTWRIHVKSAHVNLRRAMTEEVGRAVKGQGAPADLAVSVGEKAVALAEHIGVRAGGTEIVIVGTHEGITVKIDPWDVKAAGRAHDAEQAAAAEKAAGEATVGIEIEDELPAPIEPPPLKIEPRDTFEPLPEIAP
jgi:hypothetical protein